MRSRPGSDSDSPHGGLRDPRSGTYALAAVVVLILGGCAAPDTTPGDTPDMEAVLDRAFYVCPDDVVFSVDFLEGAARVDLGDRVVRLAPADTGDGQYRGQGLDLRLEDGVAWLLAGDESLRCHAEGTGEVWRDAVRRGVVFRGMGQEPGWLVEIDASTMVLLLDYGTERIEVEAPSPSRTGEGLEYRARSSGHDIRLVVEDRRCRDAMSGEPFPSTTALEVNGRSFEGCGIRLS